jgi:hypothetical protein
MFSCARRLRISGTAAPFINYVVCLAVLQGIRATARGLLQVSSQTRGRDCAICSQLCV